MSLDEVSLITTHVTKLSPKVEEFLLQNLPKMNASSLRHVMQRGNLEAVQVRQLVGNVLKQ